MSVLERWKQLYKECFALLFRPDWADHYPQMVERMTPLIDKIWHPDTSPRLREEAERLAAEMYQRRIQNG